MELQVSVTELVARARPDCIGGFGLGGPDHTRWIGAALHRAYQDRSLDEASRYRAEVPLRTTLEIEGDRVHVHGRADGIVETEDGVLIEELKSGDPDAEPAARPGAALQLRLYAWIHRRELPEERVRTDLVWLRRDPLDGELLWPPLRESLDPEPSRTEAELLDLLRPWLAEARADERRLRERRGRAGALRWPFPKDRPGQDQIRSEVAGALEARRHLILGAPTGLGKTAAVLVPCLQHALAEGGRVLFLTARATQQRAARETAAAVLGRHGGEALWLRPRRELCLNETLACHPVTCRFAAGHYPRARAADLPRALLGAGRPIGPEALRGAGERAEVCPAALARELSIPALLSIADVNYVVAPGVALGWLHGPAARHTIVVLDEAHQVGARARDERSAALAESSLRALADAVAFGGARVHEGLRATSHALQEAFQQALPEGLALAAEGAALELEPEALDFEASFRAFDADAGAYLSYRRDTGLLGGEDPVLEAYREMCVFRDALERRDPSSSVLIARRAAEGATLELHVLDAAAEVGAVFARCASVIAMSATPGPDDALRAELGLPRERTEVCQVDDPFAPEARRLVIEPGFDLRYRSRMRELPRLVRKLASLARSVPRHTLVVAPSYRMLEPLARGLEESRVPVLAQRPGDGAPEREALVHALAASPAPQVLLAVAGGALAEGVDFPDSRFAAVAVLGPCLPPPDPVREARRRIHDDQGDPGFERIYAWPGMTRAIQAGGRLVRDDRDRGLIVLFDGRFLKAPFRDWIPPAWDRHRDPDACVGDCVAVARAFFGEPPD